MVSCLTASLSPSLHEECGVFAVAGDGDAAALTRVGLHALQHRGQDGAGIVSCGEGGTFHHVRGLGHVSQVFSKSALEQLVGPSCIGHVRYATTGVSNLANVQPLGLNLNGLRGDQLWVAHNGNIVNYGSLKSQLEQKEGRTFLTTSDTELVLHLVQASREEPLGSKIADACTRLQGAFSFVFLAKDGITAVRDPHGFRPLVMGVRKNGAIVFASETCALDVVNASFEREIKPNELVKVKTPRRGAPFVEYEGFLSEPLKPSRGCLFELIYLANPSSVVFNQSVYKFRSDCGKILAREAPPPPSSSKDDLIVVPVPSSGIIAAHGYAKATGLPCEHALIRSAYAGRSFIEDSDEVRRQLVAMKLAPVREVLRGKVVVLVDDSLVRGTTSPLVVRMLREAGAKEVHLRIASPKVVDSCYFGVNISSQKELLMSKCTVQEAICRIGCDSLEFASLEAILDLVGRNHFCTGCFTGSHPRFEEKEGVM